MVSERQVDHRELKDDKLARCCISSSWSYFAAYCLLVQIGQFLATRAISRSRISARVSSAWSLADPIRRRLRREIGSDRSYYAIVSGEGKIEKNWKEKADRIGFLVVSFERKIFGRKGKGLVRSACGNEALLW